MPQIGPILPYLIVPDQQHRSVTSAYDIVAVKNWAISFIAVSGASEPCTEFSPIDLACTLRIVPAAALAGSVAP